LAVEHASGVVLIIVNAVRTVAVSYKLDLVIAKQGLDLGFGVGHVFYLQNL